MADNGGKHGAGMARQLNDTFELFADPASEGRRYSDALRPLIFRLSDQQDRAMMALVLFALGFALLDGAKVGAFEIFGLTFSDVDLALAILAPVFAFTYGSLIHVHARMKMTTGAYLIAEKYALSGNLKRREGTFRTLPLLELPYSRVSAEHFYEGFYQAGLLRRLASAFLWATVVVYFLPFAFYAYMEYRLSQRLGFGSWAFWATLAISLYLMIEALGALALTWSEEVWGDDEMWEIGLEDDRVGTGEIVGR
jgi:hypothetical protein